MSTQTCILSALLAILAFAVAAATPGLSFSQDADMESAPALEAVQPYSVTLSVADLDSSAQWYRQKLGFEEAGSKSYPEFSTKLVFLKLDGYRVELIEDGNATDGPRRLDPPKHTSIQGVSQFAFETKDIEAVKADLERRGVPITWEFENEDLGMSFVFIRDPDGNLIQYLERLE